MSYDLYLYRDETEKLFESGEIETALKSYFPYVREFIEGNNVIGFEIGQSENNNVTEFFHQGDEKNYYWSYCSYGVDKEVFQRFLQDVVTVSKNLNLLIANPQIDSEVLLKPDEFVESAKRQDALFQVIARATRDLSENPTFSLPAENKLLFCTLLIQ